MGILRSLFGRRQQPDVASFSAALQPDAPFVAIGDVHGCSQQLSALFQLIDAKYPDVPIVCVGDYVDRGEESAQVLRSLMVQMQNRAERLHCLLGNHEKMLLSFLDDPEKHGGRWLRYGGLQTLASFGVGHARQTAMVQTRDALADAMGTEMIAWLHGRPLTWVSGNVAVVHAAAEPAVPITHQAEHALLWGHPDFETIPRSDGIWVVHGHTIVDQPQVVSGRISIDTGAYATGRLTAAHISTKGVTFETV